MLFFFMPESLLQLPKITPSEYLSSIPYIYLFHTDMILIKPSSTFFIYFLGIQTIVLGMSFLKDRQSDAHLWWGLAMMFWGIGALLAGTSYQGFGYELKCNGYEYCLHTSWFELAYYYFTALSMSALGIAIAKTILPRDKQKFLFIYAKIAIVIYIILLLVGSIFQIRLLISYELFTIFFMPLYVIFFIYSVLLYKKKHDQLNQRLLVTWVLFLIVNVSYYIYYFLGIGDTIYLNTGVWFSANDVLHVLLICWMGYIQFHVKKFIDDEIFGGKYETKK
jgi:hypothetical protein